MPGKRQRGELPRPRPLDTRDPQDHPGALITALEFVQSARGLCGVPFRHQGRTRSGVDCIGALRLAASEAGLDVEAFLRIQLPTRYGRLPGAELLELLRRHCWPAPKLATGVVLVFRYPGEPEPRHFAIYSERATMIHADGTHKRVLEMTYGAPWSRFLHSIWELPGVHYTDPQVS